MTTTAQYGIARKEIQPRRFRRWKTRADGVKQRYWHGSKKPTLSKPYPARFEFTGNPEDLWKAMMIGQDYVPKPEKRFVKVSAKKFVENPQDYADKGIWVKRQVESVPEEEETIWRRRRRRR